jgi:integrase
MSVKPATHRGKPVWRIQVIRDSGAFNRRRFLDRRRFTKQHALDAETELIAEYDARSRAANSTPLTLAEAVAAHTAAPPTFAAFAATYLALRDPARSDTRNKTRDLHLHLLPRLGLLRLDAITPLVIDALRLDLRTATGEAATSRRALTRPDPPKGARRKGAPKSPKTINNILATLRAVLHLAHDYGLLPHLPRIRMERVPRPDPVFLDDLEIDRLLAAAPSEWRLLLFTAVRTGLRRGELMALRWDDLHLHADPPTIRIQRAICIQPDGTLHTKEPKGGRPRTVPLARDLIAALLAHRPLRPKPSALVFPGPIHGHLDHQRFWRITTRAARDAGLEKHVHPHLLRHTFASQCYRRGVPPQIVQMWLGHAQLSTTERYAHLAPLAGAELIDRLASSA